MKWEKLGLNFDNLYIQIILIITNDDSINFKNYA